MLWGKHRVTETPGVTGAGKLCRALCYSQSANLHGPERGHFPARKLHQCRIGSLTPLLRDASEVQRSGFAGGAGSQQRMDRVSADLSQCKFGGTEGNAPGHLLPWPAGDTRREGMSR